MSGVLHRCLPLISNRKYQLLSRSYPLRNSSPLDSILKAEAFDGHHGNLFCRECTRSRFNSTSHAGIPKKRISILIYTSLRTLSTPSKTETGPVKETKDAKAIDQKLAKGPVTMKVTVIPKSKRFTSIDYNKSYTANNFITPLRAMNEYMLKPSDIDDLTIYKRRSPYSDKESLDVLLKSDVEMRAFKVWGSPERLAKELEKRAKTDEAWQQEKFTLKRAMRDYSRRRTSSQQETPTKDSIWKSESGRIVGTAVAINGLNAAAKFVGWFVTGSASLFSEAVHSLADTCNQLILAYGIHQSLKKADSEHPYGYSNMVYITSLISGVGILCFGAGLAGYHGIMGILHPHDVNSMFWALVLMGGSMISEGATLVMAVQSIRANSKKNGIGFWEYVNQGYQPGVIVVLLEDIAAVLGVGVASTCMFITSVTGNPLADSVGSLLIGGLLAVVAMFIIKTNTDALVGRSIPLNKIEHLRNDLESDVMIRALHDVKATDLGGKFVVFKAEVDFDGQALTRTYLDKINLSNILQELQNMTTTEELEAFFLFHGENLIDCLGVEIDRIEKKLKEKHPEIRHIDLEIL